MRRRGRRAKKIKRKKTKKEKDYNMGWCGYSNYSGDGTQTLHYRFLTLSGAAKNDNEIYDEDWLTYKGTIIPKDRIPLFEKGLPKVLKKMPKTKFWNEDKAIEWQMLLHLFLDNNLKPPAIVRENGITAAEYLMEDHARDFDNPQARRYHLRRFIERVKKLCRGTRKTKSLIKKKKQKPKVYRSVEMENSLGSSFKVWKARLYQNGDVLTEWGRIGNDLQSKRFKKAGEDFFYKKIQEKVGKGYINRGILR